MLIGNDAIDPRVFTAALKYVRIRALGLPAAVVIGSAQAACLGLKDIKSPLYVLLAAAIVNAFCDAVLVPCAFPLFNGAAGAAWATVFSQFAAMGLFWKWLTWKGNRGGGKSHYVIPTSFWRLPSTWPFLFLLPRSGGDSERLRRAEERSDDVRDGC